MYLQWVDYDVVSGSRYDNRWPRCGISMHLVGGTSYPVSRHSTGAGWLLRQIARGGKDEDAMVRRRALCVSLTSSCLAPMLEEIDHEHGGLFNLVSFAILYHRP